ncbi:uncharacterized protein EV420DRAFT_729818 [Desarmillaria tabescens]|uniref:F-box domain-containing protein n=1 Tax=Armillaria tabescens TaxID=1929756 RepID=A0AA39K2X5_ARMTA|nr:uncharacterized protein EV420DRAFT_729818 [Desarmillaria tabescens]KAK0451258.1 hypothetical protein EV420DRAFT_729818 [Desarmillaria tabescens]
MGDQGCDGNLARASHPSGGDIRVTYTDQILARTYRMFTSSFPKHQCHTTFSQSETLKSQSAASLPFALHLFIRVSSPETSRTLSNTHSPLTTPMAQIQASITLCSNCGHSFNTKVSSLPLDVDAYLRSGAQIVPKLEEEAYSKTLSELRKKLSQYNSHISNLKCIVENLEAGRQLIRKSVRKVRSLVAPIRMLPLEVLSIIFEYVRISLPFYDGHNERRVASKGPFRLSAVCAYWRDICLSLPQLWTSIFANANNSDLLPCFKNLSKLAEERSCQLPLSLDVSAQYTAPHLYLNVLWSHYHFLNSLFFGFGNSTINLRRLKNISLELNFKFNNIVLDESRIEFPELEHLELSGCLEAFPNEVVIGIFAHAPKFHTLSLGNFSDIVHFRLPDEQITTIHYSGFRSRNIDALERHKRFPNVTTATFHRCNLDLLNTGDLPFRKLLLEDVLLDNHVRDHISQTTIPYLTSLELVNTDHEVYRNAYKADVFRNLVQRVSQSLTELTLTTVDFLSTDALPILRMAPNLLRLSIVEQNKVQMRLITPNFIQGLYDPGMLPELRHLQLVWSDSVNEAAVMGMVEHRAFESVVIGVRMGGTLRRDTLAKVYALRKRGTIITLW